MRKSLNSIFFLCRFLKSKCYRPKLSASEATGLIFPTRSQSRIFVNNGFCCDIDLLDVRLFFFLRPIDLKYLGANAPLDIPLTKFHRNYVSPNITWYMFSNTWRMAQVNFQRRSQLNGSEDKIASKCR